MDSCFHLSGRYGRRTVDSTFLTDAADEVMPRLGPAAVPRFRSRHVCAIFILRQPDFFEISKTSALLCWRIISAPPATPAANRWQWRRMLPIQQTGSRQGRQADSSAPTWGSALLPSWEVEFTVETAFVRANLRH